MHKLYINLSLCLVLGMTSAGFAQTAAKDGKTAWEAPNMLWVYHDQRDYAPIHARQVYHMRSDGKWEAQGGSWGRKVTGTSCRKCDAARSARK